MPRRRASRRLTAESPAGERYTVKLRPVGVPDLSWNQATAALLALGWLWHLIRHRGEYWVEVEHMVRGAPWATLGSGDRQEAGRIADETVARIRAGDFRFEGPATK